MNYEDREVDDRHGSYTGCISEVNKRAWMSKQMMAVSGAVNAR
jgi:hypothetical protein